MAPPSESDMSETLTNPRSSSSGATAPVLPGAPLLGQPSSPLSQGSSSYSQAPTLSNISKVNEGVVEGWPKLARFIAETPEFEAFPRFRELNVKTLLYYQVELALLEQRLKRTEKSDEKKKKSGQDENNYAKFANNMIPLNPDDPPKTKQWTLVLRIREVLKQYSKAYQYDTGVRVLTAFQIKPCFSTHKYQNYQMLTAAILTPYGSG